MVQVSTLRNEWYPDGGLELARDGLYRSQCGAGSSPTAQAIKSWINDGRNASDAKDIEILIHG